MAERVVEIDIDLTINVLATDAAIHGIDRKCRSAGRGINMAGRTAEGLGHIKSCGPAKVSQMGGRVLLLSRSHGR